ncbi:MAG: GGDEF domain-containing protein [Anaerolineaceae bacterium]|nr:GGDEF domain-containing protein [Anaerolineaceae bacterium]
MVEIDEAVPDQREIDFQKQNYSRLMQLLLLTMAAISTLMVLVLMFMRARMDLIIYVISTIIVLFVLYLVYRTRHDTAGFYGLIYLTSLNCLIGNTAIGWRSGIYILLLILIPIILYNPSIRKGHLLVLSIGFGLIFTSTLVLSFLLVPILRFTLFQMQVMNSINVIVTFVVLAGISLIEIRNKNKVSVRLIEVNNKLAYYASRDSLTNLLNRRTMSQYIQMEYTRSKRSIKPFGLIMADVDDFKRVNDNYGHAAGDLVLIELAGLLSATLRSQDLIARWGGEEFLILLPETDFEGVQIAAEKVRDLIAHSSVPYQGHDIQITLSIGGVVCEREAHWDDCIKIADRALYYGKAHGKNLAVFAKGDQYCVLGYSDSGFTDN